MNTLERLANTTSSEEAAEVLACRQVELQSGLTKAADYAQSLRDMFGTAAHGAGDYLSHTPALTQALHGALGGAGVGLLSTALDPNENNRKHWMHNAVTGAIAGGAALPAVGAVSRGIFPDKPIAPNPTAPVQKSVPDVIADWTGGQPGGTQPGINISNQASATLGGGLSNFFTWPTLRDAGGASGALYAAKKGLQAYLNRSMSPANIREGLTIGKGAKGIPLLENQPITQDALKDFARGRLPWYGKSPMGPVPPGGNPNAPASMQEMLDKGMIGKGELQELGRRGAGYLSGAMTNEGKAVEFGKRLFSVPATKGRILAKGLGYASILPWALPFLRALHDVNNPPPDLAPTAAP